MAVGVIALCAFLCKPALGPAYTKSLATVLVITYLRFQYFPIQSVFHCLSLIAPCPLIATRDNNRVQPRVKQSMISYIAFFYIGHFLNRSHIIIFFFVIPRSDGIFFFEIVSKSHKENSENRKLRRESRIVCKQCLTATLEPPIQQKHVPTVLIGHYIYLCILN